MDISFVLAEQNNCNVEWEGYKYNNALNECEIASSTGCNNPNYYETEEECIIENVLNECTEDSECDEGYECEEGACELDNEVGCSKCGNSCMLTTEIASAYCENTTEEFECENKDGICVREDEDDEEKVCCKVTNFPSGEERTKYNYIEEDSCVDPDGEANIVKEIVDDTFCGQQNGYTIKEKQRIKFENRIGQECPEECTCTGRTVKCELASGRIMTVYAASGNIIIQTKSVNASTNVTLYKDENGTVHGVFKGNKTKRINVFPDQVREKIRERIKDCNCSNMELDEEGYYQVQTQKQSRLFWIFKVKEKVKAQVEAQTGEVKIKNPWWGFLANDSD